MKILRIGSGACFFSAVAATGFRVPGGTSAGRFRVDRTRRHCQARVVTVLEPVVTVVLAVGMFASFKVRESIIHRERLDLDTPSLKRVSRILERYRRESDCA